MMHNLNFKDKADLDQEIQFPYLRNFISKPFLEQNKQYHNDILHYIKLGSGFWLNIVDIEPKNIITIKYEKQNSLIDFAFVLTGNIYNRQKNSIIKSMEMTSTTGQGGIQFTPESQGIVNIPGQKRLQMLHVHIEPSVLYSFLKDELNMIPSAFISVLEDSFKNRSYICQGKMNPEIQISAHQILRGPFNGIPKRMFFESKALEFISLQIAWMKSQKQLNKEYALSPLEIEKIYAAKEILIQNIAFPPTLLELSSKLSISINKLESGFREIFGMTVFAFLKEYKMQQARSLFDQGNMNVSQVAWDIGYTNVSHFSRAYKKRFGILPKQYLTSVRSRKFITNIS